MNHIIIGFGREGQSSLKYLQATHPHAIFLIFDDKSVEKLSENAKKLLKNHKNAHFFSEKVELFSKLTQIQDKEGADARTRDETSVLVVKSPGVPPSHPILRELKSHFEIKAQFTTNTQLFFEFLQKNQYPNLQIIGVTGTKGKSTTSALIHHALKTSHLDALLGGNIGVPPLDLIPQVKSWMGRAKTAPLFIVLELSSHQLSDLTFSPNIAVIQNIVPEHLDYYPDFDSYVSAKSHIARYQKTSDLVIYNTDYPQSTQLAQLSVGRHKAFTTASCQEQIEAIVPLDQLTLKGTHNLLNIMPSVIIARELGLSTEAIKNSLTSFKPLPHRMEWVAEVDGVTYYNDSLSTTPESAVAAIKSFAAGSVILIAGGFDRGLIFDELGKVIAEQAVKACLLLPTTGSKIAQAILKSKTTTDPGKKPSLPLIRQVESLEQAVVEAQKIAQENDVVLLSPASASFNMFKDYAHRGEVFKKLVI
jgi:UDP-N-acetylmuramoylalanine--D-glutamate ligase